MNHGSKALAATAFVSFLSITCSIVAATDVAVPMSSFSVGTPTFASVLLPSVVDETAAVLGLEQILFKLVSNETNLIQKLGFSSIAEITSAQIGKPLPVYIARLDKLMNLALNQNGFLGLLRSGENLVGPLPFFGLPNEVPARLLFPVTILGKTRCCIQVIYSSHKGTWRISALGMTNLCNLVATHREQSDKDFILQVPALNRHFLGIFYSHDASHTGPEAFQFKLLFNDPLFPGLFPGDKIEGSEVFLRLKNEASTVNIQFAR